MPHLKDKNIEMKPIKEQTVKPREYVEIFERDSHNIKHAHVIPPSLGSKGFGKIHIKYKKPVFINEQRRKQPVWN